MTENKQKLGREIIAGIFVVVVLALGARACHELLKPSPISHEIPIIIEPDSASVRGSEPDTSALKGKKSGEPKKKRGPVARRFLDEKVPHS